MRKSFGFSLTVAVCVCSLGWAQERREERREERAAPGVRREASGAVQPAARSADQQIAAFLFGCTRNEVELSKLAQDKATSEEVRNFAAMMVKEHSPGLEKLQQAAGPLVSAHAPGTPAAGVRKEEIREETRREPPVAPGRRVGAEERTVIEGRAAHGFDWVTIHKQLADQCLMSAKGEFQKKEGAEFDRCYMGQQIGAHMMTLDALKVLRNYASAELQKEIDETSQMATRHLAEAKKIAESQNGQPGERVSRKPKAE